MNSPLDHSTNRSSRRPRPKVMLLILGALAAIAFTGCGETPTFPDDSFAVIANADIGTGPSRLLIGVVSETEGRLGSPEDEMSVRIGPANDPSNEVTVTPVFTWIIDGAVGLWRADVEFDHAGPWQLVVEPASGDALDPIQFLVLEETNAPNIGAVAPSSVTPTLGNTALADLTSDSDPDERFYEVSLDEAIANGEETVLVFATPAFCASAACGPLLNITKEVADDYPAVRFIHVEVYEGFTEPGFVPDASHLAPSVGPDGWNLPSEPWVFVIDGSGNVTARFEGVMDAIELREVLG